MREREPYRKLKGWMIEHSISQQELADVLETTSNNINKKINGTGADFKLKEARKLVSKFQMPMSLFFEIKVPIRERDGGGNE